MKLSRIQLNMLVGEWILDDRIGLPLQWHFSQEVIQASLLKSPNKPVISLFGNLIWF